MKTIAVVCYRAPQFEDFVKMQPDLLKARYTSLYAEGRDWKAYGIKRAENLFGLKFDQVVWCQDWEKLPDAQRIQEEIPSRMNREKTDG